MAVDGCIGEAQEMAPRMKGFAKRKCAATTDPVLREVLHAHLEAADVPVGLIGGKGARRSDAAVRFGDFDEDVFKRRAPFLEGADADAELEKAREEIGLRFVASAKAEDDLRAGDPQFLDGGLRGEPFAGFLVKEAPVDDLIETCQRVIHLMQLLQSHGFVEEPAFVRFDILGHGCAR